MKKTYSYQAYLQSPYKSIKHSTYFDSYDHFFAKYRNKNITFLEIGVLGGGSLFMWRNFFGKQARIIGIDLNPEAKKWESEGFEIFIGNQSDELFWDKFKKEVGSLDVVLDDGGHTYEQQIITTENLLPIINDGGIIVIEDTHTSYMSGFGPTYMTFIDYVKKKIDSINMRFGKVRNTNSENRFWSIEIIESMVAFKINKKATNLKSEPTVNDGVSESVVDYRYMDNFLISNIMRLFPRITNLKENKFAQLILNLIVNRNFKAKKYFR